MAPVRSERDFDPGFGIFETEVRELAFDVAGSHLGPAVVERDPPQMRAGASIGRERGGDGADMLTNSVDWADVLIASLSPA